MNEADVVKLVDRWGQLKVDIDLSMELEQADIDTVMTPEVKAKIRELTNRHLAEMLEVVTPEMTEAVIKIRNRHGADRIELKNEMDALFVKIKAGAENVGKSVKGSFFQAVLTPKQRKWDGKKLEGMMLVIPALKGAFTWTDPIVVMRSNAKKKEAFDEKTNAVSSGAGLDLSSE